jgi:hypothetical protein
MTAAEILAQAAKTFEERNALYQDNYKKVGAVMHALFPDGISLKGADDFNTWHLFELMIVKITRFVNSGMNHQDSIRDACVYAAMVEATLPEPKPETFPNPPQLNIHRSER